MANLMIGAGRGGEKSVSPEGGGQLKFRDVYEEEITRVCPLHKVGSLHASHVCVEVAMTDVFMRFAGLDDGSFSDDAFTFYFLTEQKAIVDEPVAT